MQIRQMQRTYRYGENLAAMLSISASLMYFHLPPLPLSLEVSRPMYVAMPRLQYDVSEALAGRGWKWARHAERS
jgi:hypothetical protein